MNNLLGVAEWHPRPLDRRSTSWNCQSSTPPALYLLT